MPDIESLKKQALVLEFLIDAVLGIEAAEDDDEFEWLIIGGFIVGNTLGLIFDNLMLGSLCGIIGLGVGFILKAFKK